MGAGLSGIGAAVHLQERCPSQRYAILEARHAIGGTWDLFRYPGIRSDSDMYTLAYAFRPWTGERAIAEGAAIRGYIEETARENGVVPHIRFGQRVTRASWSTAASRWTVETGERLFTCRFLYACAGYYSYEAGHTPDLPGRESYRGRVVHPQQWPEDLDVAGRRVAVIGSGATAITLVPALAARGASVTMVQRSPSWVVSRPSRDALARGLRRVVGRRAAVTLARWRNAVLTFGFYGLTRVAPALARGYLDHGLRQRLDARTHERHFRPRYDPWDERLCVVPDDDLFAALRAGRASVVTGEIETLTPDGLRMRDGTEVAADVLVTATGLTLRLLGGAGLVVDGRAVDLARALSYKGVMFSDVPNLAMAFGYINASWTLKADLAAGWVCRLLRHMERHRYARCTPRPRDVTATSEPLLGLQAGYIRRAEQVLPRQGSRRPWRMNQSWFRDQRDLRFGSLRDPALEFATEGR